MIHCPLCGGQCGPLDERYGAPHCPCMAFDVVEGCVRFGDGEGGILIRHPDGVVTFHTHDTSRPVRPETAPEVLGDLAGRLLVERILLS